MSLRIRPPTGEAGWPNLLVEGGEGAGKTYACLRLSADQRVGTTFVVEVGERRADEYQALGEFVIVEHEGTLRTVVEAIDDVLAQPPTGGRPNVLVIDSATALWDLVKRGAEGVARGSKKARQVLADDPDAEIDVGHQAWNKVKDPWWWRWVNDLRAWPGIALLTARADEVAKFAGGKPVANQTEYRVDVEKGTPYALDGTVRMRVGKPPLLTTAKSLRFQVPATGIDLAESEPLAELVFGMYGAGETVTLDVGRAKTAVLAHARALGFDTEEAKQVASQAWAAHGNRTWFDADAIAALTAAVDAEAHRAEQEPTPAEDTAA